MDYTTKRLLQFHLFLSLPTELRYQVWSHAAHQPRFLEIEWDKCDDSGADSHEHYRLAAKSRLPPAILHATRESRSEAFRFYKTVQFTKPPDEPDMKDIYIPQSSAFWRVMKRDTYFNHVSDIVYFGEGAACMTTIKKFLHDQTHRRTPITNLAIATSDKVMDCHTWQWYHSHDGPLSTPYARLCCVLSNNETLMRAFPNRPSEMPIFDLGLGTRTLKNVFFVVPSSLPNLGRGDIDESISYINACTDGLTEGQIHFKRSIERDLRLIATDGKSCTLFKDQTTKKSPNYLPPGFAFISLSPLPAPNKKFSALPIENYELRKLKAYDFLPCLERRLKVHIKIPSLIDAKQKMQEIGFYGAPAAVEQAIREVHWRLVSLKYSKYDINIGLSNSQNHWATKPMGMEPLKLRNQEYVGLVHLLDIPVSRYQTGVSASSKY